MTDGQGKPGDGLTELFCDSNDIPNQKIVSGRNDNATTSEGERNFTQRITSHLRYNPALTQVGDQFLFWKVRDETLLCCR